MAQRIKLKKLKLAFVLFLIFILLMFINRALGLTLPEAVSEALKNNPDLQSAKNKWGSAKAKIPQMLSLDSPKIGLEYEQIPSGSRKLEEGMKMYRAEQMIMFPGKIFAQWQMAHFAAEMYSARYQAKVLEVTSQVKSAYYELFLADRSIETAKEIRHLLLQMKKTAETKYIVGDVSQTDVLQTNIEYLMMNNELITLEQEKKVKELKLKALLNRSDLVTLETETDFKFPASLETESNLETTALRFRPELQATEAEHRMKDYDLLKAKMEFFPDTMMAVRKRIAGGWDAMFSFTIPLYFWRQSFGVAAFDLERAAIEAEHQNMINMTVWEVRNTYVMADAARRTIELYQKSIVPQSEQALKVALAAYQTGKVDFPTLLQTERGYKEAKLKWYESQVAWGKALAELERLIGKSLD